MSRPSELDGRVAVERDLGRLLRSMRPVLRDPVYLFATLPPGHPPPDGLRPILQFDEAEGLTLVVEREAAAMAGLDGVFPCRLITLEVLSALDAVGFLASVTARLAAERIAVNVVSAYHHDHLFVPANRADDALRLLRELSLEGAGK